MTTKNPSQKFDFLSFRLDCIQEYDEKSYDREAVLREVRRELSYRT